MSNDSVQRLWFSASICRHCSLYLPAASPQLDYNNQGVFVVSVECIIWMVGVGDVHRPVFMALSSLFWRRQRRLLCKQETTVSQSSQLARFLMS